MIYVILNNRIKFVSCLFFVCLLSYNCVCFALPLFFCPEASTLYFGQIATVVIHFEVFQMILLFNPSLLILEPSQHR